MHLYFSALKIIWIISTLFFLQVAVRLFCHNLIREVERRKYDVDGEAWAFSRLTIVQAGSASFRALAFLLIGLSSLLVSPSKSVIVDIRTLIITVLFILIALSDTITTILHDHTVSELSKFITSREILKNKLLANKAKALTKGKDNGLDR